MNIALLWDFLLYGWTAAEIITAFVTYTRRSKGKVTDRGSLIVVWVTIILSINASESVRYTLHPTLFGNAQTMLILAFFLVVAGIVIRWTAILSLGKSFSVNVAIHPTQTIYQNGLYHYLRHPSYSGMLLVFLAIGIQEQNWLSLAIVLLPTTAALLYRIHVEEAALNEAFGAEYAAYSLHTKRLIPGVY